MNLIKIGKINAITGLLYFTVKIVITLIMNPLLVQFLGTTYFGIWKAVENILSFAAVADGKATQALKWVLSNEASYNDYDKKRRYVSTSIFIWLIFIPILSFIVFLCFYFSSSIINNLDPKDHGLVKDMILILGLNLIITPLVMIPDSILTSENKLYITNIILIIWAVLSAICMYLYMYLGYGLFEITLIILFATASKGLFTLIYSKKKIEWIGVNKPKKEEFKEFFRFSSWVLTWSFVARFLLASEILLIGIMINSETVTQYVFTSYISVMGVSIAAILTSSFTPGLGMLIGKKDFNEAKNIISNLREFIFAFCIFLASMILLSNKNFVILWGGENLFLSSTSNIFIAILMIQLIFIRNEAFIIDLSLNIKNKVLLGILTVIVSLLFSYFLYLKFESIEALLFGLLIGRIPLLIIFPMMTNKIIQETFILKEISLKKIFFSIIVLLIAYFIGNIHMNLSWFSFIFINIIEALVITSLILFLFLEPTSRKIYLNKLKKRFK